MTMNDIYNGGRVVLNGTSDFASDVARAVGEVAVSQYQLAIGELPGWERWNPYTGVAPYAIRKAVRGARKLIA